MYDPAWGASRAYKSGLKTKENTPASKRMSSAQWRNISVGQYDGPRASYQRYSAGPNAAPQLNRSKRNMDMR